MNFNALILPGIGNSDECHWQSLWEKTGHPFQRITQDDWHHPDCTRWQQNLEQAVLKLGPNTLLIAHSLSCLLVAHWAAQTQLRIAGALLVAPPDALSPVFPKAAVSFANAPLNRFNFASTLIASENDPYADIEYARHCANSWGAEFVNLGPAGHINSASGFGPWPQGELLLEQLISKIKSSLGAGHTEP